MVTDSGIQDGKHIVHQTGRYMPQYMLQNNIHFLSFKGYTFHTSDKTQMNIKSLFNTIIFDTHTNRLCQYLEKKIEIKQF